MSIPEIETAIADWRKASRELLAALDRHHVARLQVSEDRNQIAGEIYAARQRAEKAMDRAMAAVAEMKVAFRDDSILE